MPAKRPQRPILHPAHVGTAGDIKPAEVPRVIGKMSDALKLALGRIRDRVVLTVDLAVGANRLNHDLGRTPDGVHITPTTADATWAWALTSKDAKQIVITTVGVAQTGATVEVY